MHLKAFLDQQPKGAVAALAATLGISTVYLFQLAARQDGRKPSPELCVRLELETSRAVRRWDMRPADWDRIWPELIGAEGAPLPPRCIAAPTTHAPPTTPPAAGADLFRGAG